MSEEQNNNIVQNVDKTQVKDANKVVVGAEKEESEKRTEDKVVIHTMPKRFYSSSAGYDKSKKVGVIIMSIGVIFLLVIAVFLYFFFIKSTEKNIDVPVVEKEEENQIADTLIDKEKKVDQALEEEKKVSEEAVKEVEIDKESALDKEDIAANNGAKEEEKTEEINDEVIEKATSTEKVIEEKVVEEEMTIKEADDTDNDGLTDSEEAIFGSIVNLRDSDGDGYDDLSEVLSMYNPAGEGSIIMNPGIEKYTNLKNSYSLYYPKVATYEKVGGSEDSMMFKFVNGHIIQVIVAPNSEKLSIEEWYKKQFDVSVIKNEQRVYKKGWTGVRSEDGLVVYLTNPSSSDIYTLAYNISVDYTLTYKNIFELMINSLELK